MKKKLIFIPIILLITSCNETPNFMKSDYDKCTETVYESILFSNPSSKFNEELTKAYKALAATKCIK